MYVALPQVTRTVATVQVTFKDSKKFPVRAQYCLQWLRVSPVDTRACALSCVLESEPEPVLTAWS